MYRIITNPKTGRKVSIYSKLGNNIIKKFILSSQKAGRPFVPFTILGNNAVLIGDKDTGKKRTVMNTYPPNVRYPPLCTHHNNCRKEVLKTELTRLYPTKDGAYKANNQWVVKLKSHLTF